MATFASKRVRASLAVEAALLFPIILILILSLLQTAIFVGLSQWAQSLSEEGVESFLELYKKGGADNTAKTNAKTRVEQSLKKAVARSVLNAEESQISVTTQDDVFGPKVCVQMRLKYEFLFPQYIVVVTEGEYRRARDIRDLMQIAEEGANKVPAVKKWLDTYKEKMREWAKKLG